MTARALVLSALREWRGGRRFADSILQQHLAGTALSDSDRSFTTELFYGVLRNLTLLDFWIARLRSGSVDDASRDLLRLGLYQLLSLRTPAHAAVFETVALAAKTNRSFVNAILRTAARRSDELEAAAAAAPVTIRTSHPEFLVDRWTTNFGSDNAAALCAWNNEPAPVYARVNRLKPPVETFMSDDPARAAVPGRENFARLSHVPLESLSRGECYIQDPSTSFACELLAPEPGDTVLDACAAPGGKTALLAEMMTNRGKLFASDREPARLELLRGNLQRLGVSIAQIVQQDWAAGEINNTLATQKFDCILLDAPCSNTGVMRRRIDVRWRLREADFQRMPNEQITIARAVLPLVKPGGALVYSTCSLEPEENEQVVARLLDEHKDLTLAEQRSVLPFRDGCDGAFAARLIRRA